MRRHGGDLDERADGWIVDLNGSHRGPWSRNVIAELVSLGELAGDELAWHPTLKRWIPVREVATPPPSRPTSPPRVTTAAPAAASFAASTWSNDATAAVLAVVWAGAALWVVAVSVSWIAPLQDGLLIARIRVFGALALAVSAVFILPRAWRATAGLSGARAVAAGALRGAITLAALALLFVVTVLVAHVRSMTSIALGRDPLGQGEVRTVDASTIEIRGPLHAGIARHTRELLERRPQASLLILNSEGGWVREGEWLRDIVRERALQTLSVTGCYSACTTAFVAGRVRTLSPGARLGFHQASLTDADPWLGTQLTREFMGSLKALGVSQAFLSRAAATPPDQMWYPEPAELMRERLLDKVDTVALYSGQSLGMYEDALRRLHRQFSFLDALERTDPETYADFASNARLRYRRDATSLEHLSAVVMLANALEARALSQARAPAVARYVEALERVARQVGDEKVGQCIAIVALEPDLVRLRSPETVALIDAPLAELLQAPSRTAPSSEIRDRERAQAEQLRAQAEAAREAAGAAPLEATRGDGKDRCAEAVWYLEYARLRGEPVLAAAGRGLRP